MIGIMLPSTVLTYQVAQWGHRNRKVRAMPALTQDMAPLVIGMLLSTSWLLTTAASASTTAGRPLLLLSAASGLLIWRSRIHLLCLLSARALLGGAGPA